MTNAQKWLTAFFGIFLLLFILGRILQKEETLSLPENYSEKTMQSNQELDAMTLIRQNGCVSCHGQNLEGSTIAPALVNIKEHWTRDRLINYLRNPSSYSSDERFKEYKLKYKNIVMPAYNNLDVKDLGKIADFLLEK
ncbi:c-type cytochrome [Melioribacter sp. OK-6-Me]|uniref:c-type cytochrome n=1 Tax=unclassified Melioribacter TaxID=2627329 RepID=UPI003ED9A68D